MSVTFGGSTLTAGDGVTTPGTYMVQNDGTILICTPSGTAGSPPSAIDVLVNNGNGNSSAVNADKYTYETVPVISSLSSNVGSVAGGNQIQITATITGGFLNASAVAFVGPAGTVTVPSTSFTLDTTSTVITITVPGSPGGAVETVDIEVTTPGGTSTPITADQYSYVNNIPTISSVTVKVPSTGVIFNPAVGPPEGGVNVVIAGSGFTNVQSVTFANGPSGSIAASSYVVPNSAKIAAVAPPLLAGTYDIVVDTAGGNVTASAAFTASTTYDPAITSISPPSGPNTGGTSVQIAGSGLGEVDTVYFGPTQSTNWVPNSVNEITAVSPPGTAGTTVDVHVRVGNATSPIVTGGASYPSTVLATGPLAFWEMAETSGTTALDQMNILPGTYGGTTVLNQAALATGLGKSVDQNPGFTKVVDNSSGTVLNNLGVSNGTFSLECWVQFDNVTQAAHFFFDKSATTVPPSQFYFFWNHNRTDRSSLSSHQNYLCFGWYNGSYRDHFPLNQPWTPSQGVPYHLVVVANGQGRTVDFYVNGSLLGQATQVQVPILTNTAPLWLGRSADGKYLSAARHEDFAIYNKALLSNQVANHYSIGTGSAQASDRFSYNVSTVPVIQKVSPAAGTVKGGTAVTLTGSAFTSTPASGVMFGPNPATNVKVVNDSTLTCVSPAGSAAGPVDIVATNSIGPSATGGTPEVVLNDTFAGTVSSGWGTPDFGPAWTIQKTPANGDFNVSGGFGVMAVAQNAENTSEHEITSAVSPLVRDTAFYFEVTWVDSVADAVGINFGGSPAGILSRWSSALDTAGHSYWAGVTWDYNAGTPQILLRVQDSSITGFTNTVATGIDPRVGHTGGPYGPFGVRGQITGTNPTRLQLRVWDLHLTEPSTWTLDVTDTGNVGPQVPGLIGFRCASNWSGDGGNTFLGGTEHFHIGNLSVTDLLADTDEFTYQAPSLSLGFGWFQPPSGGGWPSPAIINSQYVSNSTPGKTLYVHLAQDHYSLPSGATQLALAVPMCVDPGGTPQQSLYDGTGGHPNNLQAFRQLAVNLWNDGHTNAIIRLGWEWSGNWFAWSNNGFANYVNAFRVIVDVMRGQASPSGAVVAYPALAAAQQFLFDWNSNAGSIKNPGTFQQWYPGNSYVDLITTDHYASGNGTSTGSSDTDWGIIDNPPGGAGGCTYKTTGLPVKNPVVCSIGYTTNFALQNGKMTGLPEWGLRYKGGTGSGPTIDEPEFINLVATWALNPANQVYYVSYFNAQQSVITSSHATNSAAALKSDFSGV